MPMTNAARIDAQTRMPRMLMLWRALQPLRSIIRFMNTGAHPDDETSGMLAALTYRDGLSISYACSTRGEGGQNDIGREAGADLGTLRTGEMERASDVLGLSMYWLSQSPTDSIYDFGFSKSGTDTLARWGRRRTLRRMVEILRADRPDIICPTFLDIPGQHGHHRAMTKIAHEAFLAAADPDFRSDGAPWQVAKMYLPAWSGAGNAYDDDLPPPVETTRIPGHGHEPVSGWSWDEIGQHSRVCHATQGMGRWVGGGEGAGWPLHLSQSRVGQDKAGLCDGLPSGFAELVPGHPVFHELDARLADTVAAFPDQSQILASAALVLNLLHSAREACPEALRGGVLHRLELKQAQLGRVIYLASGVRAEGALEQDIVKTGQTIRTTLNLFVPDAGIRAQADWLVPDGWAVGDDTISIPEDAAPRDPYPDVHHAHAPCGPVAIRLTFHLADTSATIDLPLERPVQILPSPEAQVSPQAALLNTTAPHPIDLRVSAGGDLTPPAGWSLSGQGELRRLSPPASPEEGTALIPVRCAGQQALQVTRMEHSHTGPLIRASPAVLRLCVASIELADARIGYVGGGSERVAHWLRAMGCQVQELEDADISSQGLAKLDTLVIGVFALKTRPALLAGMSAIHDWVRARGNLLTLYHRPWDNWNTDNVPLAPLEIGKPSLRYRVTDENAAVRHLRPEHPVLVGPNKISPDDWQGWVKERGLYFAKSWAVTYEPLLEMADPEEQPHQGALLSGQFGKGRHSHCALILHHQMENLVPGAFRLMANLVAPV